ncbi:MAG: ABC transporter permease [Synergistaceae bacterium]|nr:ABC transporter permease [Synergistaceae bacterium]
MMHIDSYTTDRRNIKRTFCLIAAQIILAAFLFAGTAIILGLSDGAITLSRRLGADIMIVPAGFDPHTDSIFLTIKPSASYLPDDALSSLQALGIDSIDIITPQVFMATLRASCCAYPVQIMGIDYESDFIVKSWLADSLNAPLNDGEIILGYHSTGEVGGTITFFGKDLRIAGRLERTGMGLDSSVFVNRNTIIDLAEAADKIKPQKLAADHGLVSVLMVKLRPGADTTQTSRRINRSLNAKGMYALSSKKFAGNISSGLHSVSCIIRYILVILWGMAVMILLFLLVGRKRLNITAFLISVFGAIAGIILGAVIIPVCTAHIPYMLPSMGITMLIAAASGVITVITGSLIFAETHTTTRGEKLC